METLQQAAPDPSIGNLISLVKTEDINVLTLHKRMPKDDWTYLYFTQPPEVSVNYYIKSSSVFNFCLSDNQFKLCASTKKQSSGEHDDFLLRHTQLKDISSNITKQFLRTLGGKRIVIFLTSFHFIYLFIEEKE